ncbi:MAG: hypothetical protein QXP98_03005 [Thermoproteus sp.]
MNSTQRLMIKVVAKLKSAQIPAALTLALAGIGLSLILYPALWDLALGGLLEKAVPAPIYNAIHELRHLWGIPCH